jgi:radical SAM modification target selenobiotic family peptide
MDIQGLKKFLAGFGIAGLLLGAGLASGAGSKGGESS